MNAGIIAQAAGLFAVTNIDDILVLALFFAQGAGQRGITRTIAIGQYLASRPSWSSRSLLHSAPPSCPSRSSPTWGFCRWR